MAARIWDGSLRGLQRRSEKPEGGGSTPPRPTPHALVKWIRHQTFTLEAGDRFPYA